MGELYRLFLGQLASKARIAGLLALGAVAILLAWAVAASDTAEPLEDGTQLISRFGFTLFVPVASLVFASSALGEPNEDGTLVYLWLRPIARWRIALAALAATLTAVLPVTLVPLGLAALVTGGGGDLVIGTLAATAVATTAYAGVFLWLGLRVRRALLWGLAFVLLWEGFVAQAGKNAARLAIRAHASSLLSRLADGPESLVKVTLQTSVVLPLLAAVVGVALAIRRLSRQEVA